MAVGRANVAGVQFNGMLLTFGMYGSIIKGLKNAKEKYGERTCGFSAFILFSQTREIFSLKGLTFARISVDISTFNDGINKL